MPSFCISIQGIDQLKPSLGQQVQKTFMQTQNQFQLLTAQQQHQLLAQAQVQGSIGSAGSPNYSDVDPRRFRALPRASLNGKDGQPTGNEGSIGSPLQSGSPKIRGPSQDQAELLMKVGFSNRVHSPPFVWLFQSWVFRILYVFHVGLLLCGICLFK